MQYMLTIYTDPAGLQSMSEEDRGRMHADYGTLTQELVAAGVLVSGDALEGVDTATTVRVRDGATTTTDGPFAETKEVLGGYYVVECEDLDRAIEWAAKIPGAHTGCVEVRPVMAIPAELDAKA